MRATSAVAAALCALAFAACAGSSPAPKLPPLDLEGWHETSVGEVTLLAPVGEDRLRGFADAVATLLGVAARLTNAPTEASPVPTHVVIAPPVVYHGLSTPEFSGGVAHTRLSGHFLAVAMDEQSVWVRQALLHEVTHFLTAKTGVFPYPFWYSEGFAQLLSSVRRREDVVFVGTPPWGMLDRLRFERRVHLADLLAIERGDAIRDLSAAYALSWVTVHYLSAQPDTDPLVKLVGLQGRGLDPDAAVQQALGISVSELSRRVDEHVDRLLSGAPGGIAIFELGNLRIPPAGPTRAVARAEVAWRLGEHAAALEGARDVAQSCAFYARALQEDPAHARARAATALCAARSGDFEAADAEAARATSQAPGDARVQVLAGEVRLLRGTPPDAADLAAARAAFTRATELAPNDATAWAELGATYAGEDQDPAPGIAALERARALGGWEAGLNLLLGKLQLRAGARDAARARFSEVARLDPGELGDEAERLLAEAGAAR
jgi:hypothetical protein